MLQELDIYLKKQNKKKNYCYINLPIAVAAWVMVGAFVTNAVAP